MLFYILYKIGYIISNILPLRGAYWVAERFSDIRYYVARKDREAVATNLSIVLKKDIIECRVLARKVFRNFGLYLVDFFRMLRLDEESIKRKVQIEGLEKLDSIIKQGKGAILLSCHIGNWEMGGVVMAMMGYDISAVVLRHRHKKINEFFIGQREKKGMKAITMKSTMKRCVSALLEKGLLALLGDRDFTNAGVVLDFFGVPTSIPKGPALLSFKTNSPIVPLFFIRVDRFNYKFIFDDPIEVKEAPGIEADEIAKSISKKFIPVMEKYIRQYPEQWLVFREFWDAPKDAVVL
ncbi:lysophospholipid acyltransferase family protein [Candidatus Omnitrophota bacterium]